MNAQTLSKLSGTRRPVWVVLLDFRSAAWMRLTAGARALHAGADRPVRWIDSSAPSFRPQAYGFAPKTLENALFVRCSAGLWHTGFDAMEQLEHLLELAPALPRRWYKDQALADLALNLLPDVLAAG